MRLFSSFQNLIADQPSIFRLCYQYMNDSLHDYTNDIDPAEEKIIASSLICLPRLCYGEYTRGMDYDCIEEGYGAPENICWNNGLYRCRCSLTSKNFPNCTPDNLENIGYNSWRVKERKYFGSIKYILYSTVRGPNRGISRK